MDQKQTGPFGWGAFQKILSRTFAGEAERLKTCLLAVFVLGLTAHGYGLLNFTISHDSLGEFYMASSMEWKIALGRFLEPALRCIMGELAVLPWLTGVMGLLFAGLAVYLISRMFHLDSLWENVLLSGICVTNVTVTALIATYLHDFCGDMLALLLAVCAAYAWQQMRERFSWKQTLLGAVCLGACLAFYQAYLSVTITLMCLDAITWLLAGENAATVIRRLLRAAPLGILGAAGYFVCAALVRRMAGVEIAEYYDMGNVSLSGVVTAAGEAYRCVLGELFSPGGGRFEGAPVRGVTRLADTAVCLINLVLALAAAVMVAAKKKEMGWPAFLLTLALIGLIPACMLFADVASTWSHHLTRYGVYLYPLLILLIFRSSRTQWRQALLAVLAGAVIVSNIQIANVAYVKKDLERQAALATMTRVLTQLEQHEDYDCGSSTVAIIGQIDRGEPALAVGRVGRLTGVDFEGQITHRNALEHYFDVVLQYPIRLCPEEKEAEIAASEAFRTMGTFPEKDSIATIDGVVVVKMNATMAAY